MGMRPSAVACSQRKDEAGDAAVIATAKPGRFTDCSPETGSIGHPQERQHSGAALAAGAGPSASGEGLNMKSGSDRDPHGTRPAKGGAGLGRATAR